MLKISLLTFLMGAAILLAACGKDESQQSANPPTQGQPTPPVAPAPPPPPAPPAPPTTGGGQCKCDRSGCYYLDSCACLWRVGRCEDGQQIEAAIQQYSCNGYHRAFGY